ncbi:erythropoiesis-stimulating protein [Streptomyces sp. AS58]|uniref:Helix-turn-helix transcriptional regulator n=1 Tax=Streptomyces cadmiisoli TaxID=2184053 RepID=A0A2Z4IRZ6_9ACTN|nr:MULTISPECIES: TrmB family transcriptional regulator [Streptomyces]AWW35901.1 helix-turn-helix transcriptional regulator [Streptomyces cadmiisoli]KOV69880.1 erythropoiesis-stimulating protein [Streptomyces sp. AS58]
MLSMLGLDEDTEALYRTMLMYPDLGVSALSEHLGRPQEAIRRGLDQLSELALVRPSFEEPGRLRAVTPEVGLELLLKRQQADLAAQQQRVEASRAAAAQLIADFADVRSTTTQAGVEHLVGIDDVRDRLATLACGVENEVMTLVKGQQSVQALEAAKRLDEHLADRGVSCRTVYLHSARNCPRTTEYLTWLVEQGGQVRTVATLPTRMVMFDRTRAVIPLKSDDTTAGGVVLSGEGTLAMLDALFETIWDSARPWGDESRPDAHGLTDSESTVLKLLAAGYTDEAIAKRLGVSHRTARRKATCLMERLGARSRFEAGVQAAKRGWL